MPRDDTERKLAEIWQRVLGTANIDMRANFFELGGHSLAAVQLFALCEQAFGCKLPLSTLVHAPTLAQLAGVVRQALHSPSRCLVGLREHGTRPPFFCMHAESGQVHLIYRRFAQLLGDDQPVYALQAQGLDGRRSPHASIEAMAAHYLDEIRSVQPEGPYFIGGFCLGAVISFEMAQQLHAGGEKVALLAALDASGPRFERSLGDYLNFAVQALRKQPLAVMRYLVSTRVFPKPIIVPEATSADIVPAPSEVPLALRAAFQRYKPRPYPGRIAWFVNSERAALAEPQWGEFAEGVERWVFPGGHATMFQPPAIETLAVQVKACLQRIQAEQPPRLPQRADASPPAPASTASRPSIGAMSTSLSAARDANSSTNRSPRH